MPSSDPTSLLAVLFVTNSSSGTNLVFHYPPRPELVARSFTRSRSSSTTSSSTSSTSDEGDASDSDNGVTRSDRKTVRSRASQSFTPSPLEDPGNVGAPATPLGNQTNVKQLYKQPWDTVLGFDSYLLADLLSPQSVMCDTKFELSVDELIFLGHPCHVRPDGTWSRKKHKKKGKPETIHEEQSDDEKKVGGLLMFHLVFVMNSLVTTNETETRAAVSDMYDHIVTKMTSALKFEQARCGYVARESEKIMSLREKATSTETSYSDLWQQIVRASNLAATMASIFDSIAAHSVAHINVNSAIDLCLQIPLVTYSPHLPVDPDSYSINAPLLTTSTLALTFHGSIQDHLDVEESVDPLITPHFGLLLLDEPQKILQDLPPADSNSVLAQFVKNVKPTQSFLQVATGMGVPVRDVVVLAGHLCRWRRGRVVVPLHPRNTYVVSPTADMRKLAAHIPLFKRLFPTLPSLPYLLALFSGKPRPYSTFIPTRDHRGVYLEVLTWLVRENWVCELKNFVWVKVGAEVKRAVRELMRRAAREAKEAKNKSEAAEAEVADGVEVESTEKVDDGVEKKEQKEKVEADAPETKAPSEATDSDSDEEDLEDLQDSIIPDPARATSLERAWLEHIASTKPPEIAALFDRIVKYFNGKHAVEKVALREGITRREVRRVLGGMEGDMVVVMHW
ncbi:Nitrogen permease regulator 3 [Saitoella coloradoensis]